MSHTHTPAENNTPDTDTHTRQEQHPKPPDEHLPQTLNNAQSWRDDGACHLAETRNKQSMYVCICVCICMYTYSAARQIEELNIEIESLKVKLKAAQAREPVVPAR